ncbi:MAG: PEP-CTERM sorting domain-containing protein, partial [Aquabacterium sp.]
QSTQGTLDTELTSLLDHDLLLVNGNVALNGTLALSCLGNCGFGVGDEVVILDATGQLSGSFAQVTMSGFGTGAFDVIYDLALDRVVLRVTEAVTPVPVPEPGTYALMAAGLAAVGWMARRRRIAG